MKKVFLLSIVWMVLFGCKKEEPKPTPDTRQVEFYFEFGGKKGKCYSIGLYLYEMSDANRTKPVYSAPLVTGSLDKDYTQEKPLRVWVPYPGLTLEGDYRLWVETFGGNSPDSLRFIQASGVSPERVPFRPRNYSDSASYYRSLGACPLL